MQKFPFVKQLDSRDCGPACLSMIAAHYGKIYSLATLRRRCFIGVEGVSLLGISDAAESIGMRTRGVRLPFDALATEVALPCIAHWRQNHFVVVYKIQRNRVFVADPGHGLVTYTYQEFLGGWGSKLDEEEGEGICLLLEAAPEFFREPDETSDRSSFGFLLGYLTPHRSLMWQLLFGVVAGSLLQLLFPFLTQSIVDKGIEHRDIQFIYLVLIAQLVLFCSQTATEMIRGWILLHVSTRISVSLISDFLIKLMNLPIGFFSTRVIGDLMQRIGDHTRIEQFLTRSTLDVLFSMLSLVLFTGVLAVYSSKILLVFAIGTFLYVAWIVLFMRRRRELDFKRFDQLAVNQSTLFQMITGIQEIKLNNCERVKRWDWERIQARLFKVNVQTLSLGQYQSTGSSFINQLKNIFISFIAAKSVLDGEMTLGMMMAVQYIIGQLNAPIQQLIGFAQSLQDATISMERLNEIHGREDEEAPDEEKMRELPPDRSISIRDLCFQYDGPHSEFVLRDLSLELPARKVTAIVGVSGSGKTTLIKLLLGFYPPTKGEIRVGDVNLDAISKRVWRGKCGAVMQDGFIFSDSIARNIALGDEHIDNQAFRRATKTANVEEMIASLPIGYSTKIGMEGHGLSQGQKQRILIARSVYKNPEYLFFDEATNALDANNERLIMTRLGEFIEGRTVVIVAHRLSTVRHADQIVVLDKGRIVERGTHEELAALRGAYFELVRNQLELGT